MVTLITSSGCSHSNKKNKVAEIDGTIFMNNIPPQPGANTWKFTVDLKSPLWARHQWIKSTPASNQADLSAGVCLKPSFPDKEHLGTAYEDLACFLAAGDVPCNIMGKYTIETVFDSDLKGEAFRLEIRQEICRIIAGDAEGIRRGIYYIEYEMLGHRGPFLNEGNYSKYPVIERRISRCFFGPIKRPPGLRDELMDTIDYYPEQYLNRLAHEGVNGLWLTVEFRDLASTSFKPADQNAWKRLAKLRRTVQSCLRYGIRTYIFCIEPHAWERDNPIVKKFPELQGGPAGDDLYYFCPGTETGRKYLYESVNSIFRAVPNLGGMINISLGERPTICLSEDGKINCLRCSHKVPWEVLYSSLSAMEKGMHDAAPDAELISWLYLPQPQRFSTGDSFSLDDWVYDIPAHTPKGVIIQFNFESGVSKMEFGKLLVGGDYWLSEPGPSSRFMRIARVAAEHGTKVSAKIQTANSHEVATVPYVPVPSLLYRKFNAMRNLRVSHTMLSWYFGNYPGVMNMAAGQLSFEPFPGNEEDFLKRLASVYWKDKDIPDVVQAWKAFSEAYGNYPLTNLFQYYGPMTDGPVWPLFLRPVDLPLSPTWLIASSRTLKAWPPSGDRIGECLGDVLTLPEAVELTRRMSSIWNEGLEILKKLEPEYVNEPDRLLDIGVARALGIQFRSGYNILRFYQIREEMYRMAGKERLDLLTQLEKIINNELELDSELLDLCRKDSRLGFHSEAEGYKYYPEKIRWRMEQLKRVLSEEIPLLTDDIKQERLLFPAYTGKEPAGPSASAMPETDTAWLKHGSEDLRNPEWNPFTSGPSRSEIRWAARYDADNLYIILNRSFIQNQADMILPGFRAEVKIEPRRLFPSRVFEFSSESKGSDDRRMIRIVKPAGDEIILVIPFRRLFQAKEALHPVRLNILVYGPGENTTSWLPYTPAPERLILGSDNPACLGWLLFH